MKNFFKGKLGTAVILIFTLILAGVAIFTALRLYQLKTQPVAPNVPSSIPKAAEGCSLTFTLTGETASPTPTETASGSPTPTSTGTPTPSGTPNSCNGTCGSNSNCSSGLYCNTSVGLCRNSSCPTETDCTCGTSTPTPTPRGSGTPRPSATPTAPALPASGTDWPTLVGAGLGIFVIIGSLLLAL